MVNTQDLHVIKPGRSVTIQQAALIGLRVGDVLRDIMRIAGMGTGELEWTRSSYNLCRYEIVQQ